MATPLSAGDIGFTTFNADSIETFSFVLLADVDASTTISFTDNGWLSSGALRRSEGILDWTSGAALAAGTVITIDTAAQTADFGTVLAAEGSFNLSGGGDQVLAFQGSADAPSFIGAINNFSTAGAWQAGSDDSNETDLPPGLVDGVSAVSIAHIDNVVYDGPTTGGVAALRAGLYDPANWTTGSNSTTQSFTGTFTISGAGPDVTPPLVAALSPADDATGVDAAAAITVSFNEAAALVDAAGVTLHRASDDAVVASAATLSGATLTITPDAALDPVARFDELRLSAEYGYFSVESFEFAREELLLG
ncbi:Ig-like domain-containing protein [Rhodovulum sp. DZ06]|uniref:Ig-like domain-containing protein n=1 Tax=Rhodovulum sp. DZ06 TaxID=3425126 RepID=UPI003D33307B